MSTVDFLHALQHVNHTFAPVSSQFILPKSYYSIYDIDTKNDYFQSIQMFCLVPLEIWGIYIVVYMVLVLTYCCYGKPRCMQINIETYSKNKYMTNNNNNSNDKKLLLQHKRNIGLTPCAKSTRVLLSISVYVMIASSIYCGILLEHQANVIGNNINNSYQPYQQNIIYGNTINKSLHDTIISISENNHNDIKDKLEKSQKYLNSYLIDATSIPSWDSTQSYLNFSHSFSQFVIYFGMLVCVVLAVTFFMSLFSGTMIKFMSCLTFICILLLLLLFSAQFAFSITLSDACANPNDAILQIASNKTTKSEIDTMKYYLYCDDKHSFNPLYNQFNNSFYAFLKIDNKSIYSSNNKQLIMDYNTTLINMHKLNNSLQCQQLYDDKQMVVDSVCVHGVTQWFRVYMIQFGIILLLVMRNCCLCCGIKYYKKRRKRIINHNGDYDKNNYDKYDNNIDYGSMSNSLSGGKYVKYSINTPPVFTNNSPSFNKEDDEEEDTMFRYNINNNNNHNLRNSKIYIRRENGKTEYIKMNGGINNKTIHDLKQEIQIKWGYVVQTQEILYNNTLFGCKQKLNEIGIKNGSIVYLKLKDTDDYTVGQDDNFTVEYNGYIELNSYVPTMRDDDDDTESTDNDDHDINGVNNDYWSIRIDEFCIHSESDMVDKQYRMIGIIIYQYDGKVEFDINGIKYKSGDVVLKNITSLKYCQYETMFKHIFGIKLDGKFIGNGFKINKDGKIKQFSNEINKIGKLELFWLQSLIDAYYQKGIKIIDIEHYQKTNSRYRYDIDKFECSLCGVDQYIEKESNNYPLIINN